MEHTRTARARGSARQFAVVTALTCARAPLILLFLAGAACDMLWPETLDSLAAHQALRWTCLSLMLLSSATDLFDGLLARRWNVTSKLGAICDPLMDKAFFVVVYPTVTAMLFLSGDAALGLLALAATVLHILRDLWVVTLRSLAVGKSDMRANFVGKLRTALGFPAGMLAYCYVVMGWGWLSRQAIACLLILCLLLNLYSAYAYTRRYGFAVREAMHEQ